MNKIRIIAFKVNRACSRIGAVVDTWWPRDDDDRVRAIFDHKNFFQPSIILVQFYLLNPNIDYKFAISKVKGSWAAFKILSLSSV